MFVLGVFWGYSGFVMSFSVYDVLVGSFILL